MTFRAIGIMLTTSFVLCCIPLYIIAVSIMIYMNFRDFYRDF